MGTTGLESDTSIKCCLICTVPIHFTRLGVHACRACAAFYKRAVLTGKRLICRRGDNKCVFRKHEKFMCRKCRFDKCVELGMEYTPGEKGAMKETTDEEPSSSSSLSSPSSSNGHEQTLLEKIRIAHEICCENRRVQELELIKKHNLERVPDCDEEVYLVNFACGVAASAASVDELSKFFLSVFPSMKELPEADQLELFRLCIPQFVTAYCRHSSIRIWGRIDRYMMASMLMCTDAERLEVWAGHHVEGPLKNEMISLISSYVADQKRTIIPTFEKADLSDKELLALLPLLLSEAELPQGAEKYQPLLDSIRSEILKELYRYYTEELGINEYSTRLGNLLTICGDSRESYELFTKFFRMQVTVFDLYATETMLQDLIL